MPAGIRKAIFHKSSISSLSPTAWYDFSDSSTVNPLSFTVLDKGDNSFNASKLTGVKPNYNGFFNGKNVASFPSGSYLITDIPLGFFTEVIHYFCVFRSTEANTLSSIPVTFTTGNFPNPLDGYGANRLIASNDAPEGYSILESYTPISNITQMSLFELTLNSASFKEFVNLVPSTPIDIITNFSSSGRVIIASREDSITQLIGDIGEILIFNYALESGARDLVNQYLNNRWAIF
jgi:hypothetical protein